MSDRDPSLDLTGAEIELLRALPQRIAAVPAGTNKRDQLVAARRRRLQNWGLLTIRHEPEAGCFVVMITDAGVSALTGARGTTGGAR